MHEIEATPQRVEIGRDAHVHVLSSKRYNACQGSELHWAGRCRACELLGLNSLRYIRTRVEHGRVSSSVIA
jgi:hypothetical protein